MTSKAKEGKKRQKSLIGWISKDGGKLYFDSENSLCITCSGIWKYKMGNNDKKIKITIEEI